MNHLLVVDDSLVDRELAGGLLEARTNHYVEFANDGLDALEQLEARLPLVVITDLQMPQMNGIELVELIRRRYPTVPVVLMTGYGSEDIAVRALMAGAADYVSKDRLAEELPAAVETVLALSAQDRPHQRLWHCLRYEELRYELDNDVMLIPPLVDQLRQSATEFGLIRDDTDGVRLGKALAEAVHNAIYHGNLELSTEEITRLGKTKAFRDRLDKRRAEPPYCDRRVEVIATMSPQEGQFVIRDQGPGFDASRLPDVQADPAQLTRSDGRGLVLIKMFLDEVRFSPKGNEITLIKRPPATDATGGAPLEMPPG